MTKVRLNVYPNVFYLITNTGERYLEFANEFTDMLGPTGIAVYRSLKKFKDVALTYNISIATVYMKSNIAPSNVTFHKLIQRDLISQAYIADDKMGYWTISWSGKGYTKEGSWNGIQEQFPGAMPMGFMNG